MALLKLLSPNLYNEFLGLLIDDLLYLKHEMPNYSLGELGIEPNFKKEFLLVAYELFNLLITFSLNYFADCLATFAAYSYYYHSYLLNSIDFFSSFL